MALLVGAAGHPAAAEGSDPRPNIILVLTDDETLENQRVMTYVNSTLGTVGTTFSNAIVSFPLCCPSRASILTGQYAHNHGVLGNHAPRGGWSAFDETHTLATWLDAAGYFTSFTGKYLNEYGAPGNPTTAPLGWDDWYAKVGAGDVYYHYWVSDDGELVYHGEEPSDYSTDVYGAHAAEIVRSRAGQPEPFFLQVAPMAPHGAEGNQAMPAPRHKGAFRTEPLPQPPSFNEEDVSDKPLFIQRNRPLNRRTIRAIQNRYRLRLESLLAVDELVQGLETALQEIGEDQNTIVIFTSDNGFLEGQHRVTQGKVLPYEESARVPLIIAGPGFQTGSAVATPVANIDLAPTIVRAAQATPDLEFDGIPLQDVLADPDSYATRPLLLETFGSLAYTGVRTPGWVYVEYSTDERELYDLVNDPYQLDNLADDPAYADTQAALAAQLALLRDCAGASCQLP